ncbi:MAG: putative porin [Bacteroidales bacterium]|nr:putative porin [Bacteroidales bacterium]
MRNHRFLFTLLLCLTTLCPVRAQSVATDILSEGGEQQLDEFGNPVKKDSGKTWGRDTTKTDHTVPTDFHQWRIDERLGTVIPQQFNDTLSHRFPNFNSTDGYEGEYSYLGNLASPRLSRIYLNRDLTSDLMFLQPYDYFHTTPSSLLFTNTKSPLTNLSYHSCGTRENGQDRFRAYFASNINKIAGLGFKVDYAYGRGYYNNQANSLFGGTLFGYYQGERYDMHLVGSWSHMKTTENGGIEDDTYITDPESFSRSVRSRDIPTLLSSVWNRNDVQTYFLNHRYHLGVYHETEVPDSLKPQMPSDNDLLLKLGNDSVQSAVRADSLLLSHALDSLREAWQSEQVIPQDFIPVTSFFHTMKVQLLKHNLYMDSQLPSGYWTRTEPYYRSLFMGTDRTTALSLKNTLGVQLREGFNKWAKAGITLFAAHELERFDLPDSLSTDTTSLFNRYVENHVSVGGEIQKLLGKTLHYSAGVEFWAIGPKAGDLDIHGTGDLNFRLFKDTVHLAAKAFFKNVTAPFYYRHYHSQALWWDRDYSQETHTRIEGTLSADRLGTSIRFGVENISNYTYLSYVNTATATDADGQVTAYTRDVAVKQQSGSIQVMSATLKQDFHFGFFHWENSLTWQHTTNDEALPLPMLTLYTNPYITLTLAKVLRIEAGVDLRYFTEYYAPDYAPLINQFAVQDPSITRMKLGNYPIFNGYVNIALKRFRAYVNVKHFNEGSGRSFLVPHYPIDPLSIHFGISWNFYD